VVGDQAVLQFKTTQAAASSLSTTTINKNKAFQFSW
jgi:hypothetical protein